MKKHEGALKPEAFNLSSYIKQDNFDQEVDPTEEEIILATGADKAFWITLKKHIESAVNQLENLNEEAMSGGMPLEEIGRNAIVMSQVKGIIRKIVNLVEDAREAQDGKTK